MERMNINGRMIANNTFPYFVAEVNSSHNGNLATAMEMADEIRRIGCDAIKFQSWSAETLYSADYYKENPIAKRMVSKFAMSEEQLFEISKHCRDIGLTFFSTPYSRREVDFLVDECKAPMIKVASMDINNYAFLAYIANKGVPVILSTGMSSFDEIEKAVEIFKSSGNDALCILHCVSQYPVDGKDVNLRNMQLLKDRFPDYSVGYSDHTTNADAAAAATALGAALIEKHFTLNNKKIGWDNQMATEPSGFTEMIEKCHAVFDILGSYERNVSEAELEQRTKMRRSIVAARDLKAGQIISLEDLDAKRPATGLPADRMYTVVGQRLCRDIAKDEIIFASDLEGQV